MPLTGLRVLLVDNDADSLEVTRLMLEAVGAKVLTATRAPDALATLQAERPDVALCDLSMPEHDGYWLLRQVRALSPGGGGQTPFAAFTAHASEATRQVAIAAGFEAHVTKPTEPSELVRAIQTLKR
jgi:CheY-like chemotaxis protein